MRESNHYAVPTIRKNLESNLGHPLFDIIIIIEDAILSFYNKTNREYIYSVNFREDIPLRYSEIAETLTHRFYKFKGIVDNDMDIDVRKLQPLVLEHITQPIDFTIINDGYQHVRVGTYTHSRIFKVTDYRFSAGEIGAYLNSLRRMNEERIPIAKMHGTSTILDYSGSNEGIVMRESNRSRNIEDRMEVLNNKITKLKAKAERIKDNEAPAVRKPKMVEI